MPKHEIYNFLKENGLTQKDEASFVKEYSDPKKAAELHKFFTDNGLTQKDSAAFYDTYFNPSKKKEPQYSSVSPTAAKPSVPTFGAIKVSTMPAQQVLKEQPKVPTPSSTPRNDFADLEKLYEQKRNAQSKITSADAYTLANELPQSVLDEMNAPYVQEVSKIDKLIEQRRTALKPIIAKQAGAVERNWQAFTKDGVPDYEKIYNYAGQVSKQMGGGSNVKEEVAKAMIEAATAGRIGNKAEKRFQEKTGYTPQSFIAEKKKKGGFTPEDAITLENLYKASVNEVVGEEGKTKEAVAAALPLMERVGAAFVGAIQGGIASQGEGLAAMGVSNKFTDYLRGFKTGAEQMELPQKEWTTDNIVNDPLGTVLPFVAQQAGVSLPGMIAGIGASLATGSPVAGAIITSLSEKAANTGDVYNQLIEQGLPVDVAKERAAAMMRPMVTDALNFVEMDVLLKAVKGKGNIVTNMLLEGASEVPQEYQQQYEQERAINPNITVPEFLEKVGGADLAIKTFTASAAMGGAASTIGKVYGVLSQKVPNAVTQKLQSVVQQQGALAAKDAVDAQVENGTIAPEEAEKVKLQVDELEAADKSLEQLGVSPEVRLAAGALSTRITELDKQIAAEKNPAVLSKLNQEKKAAQSEMDAIVSGEKGFVVITPEGGSPYAVPEAAAKEVVADLKEEIQNGEVKAEKVGEVAVELPKPKKRRLPKLVVEEEQPAVVEEAAPPAAPAAEAKVEQPKAAVSESSKNVEDLGGDIKNKVKDVESIVLPIGEIDNLRNQKPTDLSSMSAIELSSKIEKNGIEEPLRLVYYPKEGKALLSDGHNRLDVSKDLGAERLPVKIIESFGDAPKNAKDWTPPKALENALKQPTPTATKPIQPTATEPAAEAKAGVAEEVQPSPVIVGQGEAKGTAAVLTSKSGKKLGSVSIQSRLIETVKQNEIGDQVREYNPQILLDVVEMAYDGKVAQEIADALNKKYQELNISRNDVKSLREYLGIPKSDISTMRGIPFGGKTSEEQRAEFNKWKEKIDDIKGENKYVVDAKEGITVLGKDEVSQKTTKNVTEQVGIAKGINDEIESDIYVAVSPIKIGDDSFILAQIKENNNDRTFIIQDENGAEIGIAQLSANGNYLENIRIDEKYRRKGLATRLYDFIELRKGIELQPSPIKQSQEAVKLWEKRRIQKSVSNKVNGGLLAKALSDAIRQTFGGEAKGAAAVLTPEQDVEVIRAGKPSVKLELVAAKDLVNSQDPLAAKKKHDDIKERYKLLKAFMECL